MIVVRAVLFMLQIKVALSAPLQLAGERNILQLAFSPDGARVLVRNRRALHDYAVEETEINTEPSALETNIMGGNLIAFYLDEGLTEGPADAGPFCLVRNRLLQPVR